MTGRRHPRWRLALSSGLAAVLILLAAPLGLADESRRAVPADLLQKAWSTGKVRVIVELGGVGAVPEGHLLSGAAVVAQRGRIAADRAALRSALRGLRHRVLREFKTIPYVGLEADYDTLRVLDSLPGLATRIHEDVELRGALAQSEPVIKAPDAWAAGWDGTDQVIAIVDSGVDKTHPFLAGKVIEEACYDSSGVSTCPNGLAVQTSTGAAVPCDYSAADCYHGTHVAGIAAGNGAGASVSFSGVARGANLIAVRTSHSADCDGVPCALHFFSDIVSGLERVYELRDTYPIAAANLSMGGNTYPVNCNGLLPAMDAIIANLRAAKIATVVASGNDGQVDRIAFPACISTAISVGATGDGSGGANVDTIRAYSNSASFLTFLAPGSVINSSVPGGGFENHSGTSMAAPHVAGAWAIAKQANPDASVDDILAGLQNTGRIIVDPGNGFSFPRIAATLLQFSASTYGVGETGTATITVNRYGSMFGPNFAPLTIDFATSAGSAIPGSDYTETSGTLEFAAGETSKAFTVPILNDSLADGPRTVNLALSNPDGGALLGIWDTAVLTISDNDVAGSIQFSASAFSLLEGAGSATITVKRTGGSAGGVTVHYATSDGTAHAPGDYQTESGTLTFDPSGPGATTQTFTVPIVDNGAVDGNRTVNLTLSAAGGGGTLGGQKTAVLTIVDDEIALQFSQASYSVGEGGNATITVTRSGPTQYPVGVTYTVLPGSATPADYGGISTAPLAFAANQTSRTFTIPTVNDKLAEGPETVLLQLSSPSGGAILGPRQTAVLTIVDNDAGGTFRFGASTYNVSEAATTVAVVVTRSNGAAGNGKVRVVSTGAGTATPNVDYVPVDQVLLFPADISSQTVFVSLTASNVTVEATRTIQLALQEAEPVGLSGIGSPATATIAIGNNDAGGTIQWSPASVSVSESAATVTLNAVRTGGAAGPVGATWTITGGNAVFNVDYTGATAGTVEFAANSGVPVVPVTISLLNPAGPHGNRTIEVTLSNQTGGATLGSAKVFKLTLLDDEVGFRFDKAAYPTNESSGSQTVTVLRTGPAQAAASVTVGTVDAPDVEAGTAAAGTDYMPTTTVLSFAPNQTSRTFTVPLKNDVMLDGLQTVKLKLSSPSAGTLGEPSMTTIGVADNDTAGTFQFTSATYTGTEGTSGNVNVTITVTRTGGAGGTVEVPWSITGGTATTGESGTPSVDVWIAPPGTLSFGPNVLTRTIQATIVSDTEVEPNETVVLELGTPTPGGALGIIKKATLVVVDNDRKGTIQFGAPIVNAAEADASVTIPVTRTGNLGQPASVGWTISGGTAIRGDLAGPGIDYVSATGGTLTFAAGQSTPTVPLTIAVSFDAVLEPPPETVEFALQGPSEGWALGAIAATTVNLVDGTVQFSGLPYTVSEASGSKTVTVTRTGVTTQAVTVSYSAGPPGSAKDAASPSTCLPGDDYRPVSGMLTFSPGQTSKTFSVPLCGDSAVEGNEDLTLTLAVVSGPAVVGPPGASAVLTITENDVAGTVRFSSATYAGTEGQNGTLTVTRTGSGGGVTVHWAITGGSAVHDTDYTGPTEGDIPFASGQTSRTITIPLVNTPAADGPRTVVVELSGPLPVGLASLGAPSQATLTINDNEPTLRLNSATYVVGEASASFNVTVLRSGPTTAAVSVNLVPQQISSATGGACGVGGADFSSAVIPVTIPAGQGSKTVPVALCPDTRADGTESFGLALQSPSGATLTSPSTATVSLSDNDVAGTLRWSVADASSVAGGTIVLTVTRTGGAASEVTVDVTAHDGDGDTPGADALVDVDYAALPPTTLTFDANTPSRTVEITLLPRDGAPGPRAFRVTLESPTGNAALGSPSTVVVWILDPPP